MKKLLTFPCYLILIATVQVQAQANDDTPLQCRIEIEERDDHFKFALFLKNPTERDITVVMGRGGVDREVTPSLNCNHRYVSPANFRGYARRSMRPVPLTIRAGKEILYDTYVVGYPQRISGTHSITAQIQFPDSVDHRKRHVLLAEAELEIPKAPNQ